MIIHLAGASATGKTTLAGVLAEEYGLKVLPSAARQVFKRTGFPSFAQLLSDPVSYAAFQDDVVSTQLAMEEVAGDGYVTDRCLDQFVFSALYGRTAPPRIREAGDYLRMVKVLTDSGRSLLFRVAPTVECYAAAAASKDRSEFVHWESMLRFDGALDYLLRSESVAHRVLMISDRGYRVGMVRDAVESTPSWKSSPEDR